MQEQVKSPSLLFMFFFLTVSFIAIGIPIDTPNALAQTGLNPWHSDLGTVNFTQTANVNNSNLRGFDPKVIKDPTDPFPDTSRPCCQGGSTLFGNGLASGSSHETVNQNCASSDFNPPQSSLGALAVFGTGNVVVGSTGASSFPGIASGDCVPQVSSSVFNQNSLFQQSRNSLLSRPQTVTEACNDLPGVGGISQRCNEITFGFLQNVQTQNQSMDINFAIRSLTDANGNLIGAAQGTFTQSITGTDGTPKACSGTFTFDEINGFVMTSGPLNECP
jgi:hypothetical protein